MSRWLGAGPNGFVTVPAVNGYCITVWWEGYRPKSVHFATDVVVSTVGSAVIRWAGIFARERLADSRKADLPWHLYAWWDLQGSLWPVAIQPYSVSCQQGQ